MFLIHYFSMLITICAITLLFCYVHDMYPSKTYPAHVHTSIYIDRNFSSEEQEYITAAALDWSINTNHIIDYDIIPLPSSEKISLVNSLIFIKMSPDNPNIILLDHAKKNTTLAFYNESGPLPFIAVVSDRLDEDNYKEVMLHELGHSLGLEHVKGDDGLDTLMYPYVELGATHITPTDLKQFCKLYRCDANKLQH